MEIYPLYDETPQLRRIQQVEVDVTPEEADRVKTDLYDRQRLQWQFFSSTSVSAITLSGGVIVMLVTRLFDVAWLGVLLAVLGVIGLVAWLILYWSESIKVHKLQGFCCLFATAIAVAVSFHDILFYCWIYYHTAFLNVLSQAIFWGLAGVVCLVMCVLLFGIGKAALRRKWRGY